MKKKRDSPSRITEKHNMSALTSVSEQKEICNDIYKQFSTLVTQLTDLCANSESKLEEYKRNLDTTTIPEIVCIEGGA